MVQVLILIGSALSLTGSVVGFSTQPYHPPRTVTRLQAADSATDIEALRAAAAKARKEAEQLEQVRCAQTARSAASLTNNRFVL